MLGPVPLLELDAAELGEERLAVLRVRRGLRAATCAVVAARGGKFEHRELGRARASHAHNVAYAGASEERRTMS